MDIELLNGCPKCSIIESFAGRVLVVRPGFKREFQTIEEAQSFVKRKKWEINISFIKGSKVAREILQTGKEVTHGAITSGTHD